MSKCYNTKEEREKIILDNKGLVYHTIKKKNLLYRIDDLEDMGLIALVKGVDGYDADKGIKLSTYLCTCIDHEISNYLAYEKAQKRTAKMVSLNTTISEDGTELIEVLGNDPYYEDEVIHAEMIDKINRRLAFLSEKDEYIFKSFWGIDGHKQKTSYELSKELNCSQQEISRRKEKMMNMMRYVLSEYGGHYEPKRSK